MVRIWDIDVGTWLTHCLVGLSYCVYFPLVSEFTLSCTQIFFYGIDSKWTFLLILFLSFSIFSLLHSLCVIHVICTSKFFLWLILLWTPQSFFEILMSYLLSWGFTILFLLLASFILIFSHEFSQNPSVHYTCSFFTHLPISTEHLISTPPTLLCVHPPCLVLLCPAWCVVFPLCVGSFRQPVRWRWGQWWCQPPPRHSTRNAPPPPPSSYSHKPVYVPPLHHILPCLSSTPFQLLLSHPYW